MPSHFINQPDRVRDHPQMGEILLRIMQPVVILEGISCILLSKQGLG